MRPYPRKLGVDVVAKLSSSIRARRGLIKAMIIIAY